MKHTRRDGSRDPKRITIHCTATKDGESLPKDVLRKMHLARGFRDIGYHLIINTVGIYYGRPLNVRGAHVGGANTGNVGIAIVGTNQFFPHQLYNLKQTVEQIQMTYDIPNWEIYTHYLFKSAIKQGKTCPNMTIQRLLAYFYQDDFKAIQPYILKE